MRIWDGSSSVWDEGPLTEPGTFLCPSSQFPWKGNAKLGVTTYPFNVSTRETEVGRELQGQPGLQSNTFLVFKNQKLKQKKTKQKTGYVKSREEE